MIGHIIAVVLYFFGFGLFIGAPTFNDGLVGLVFLIPAMIIHYRFWLLVPVYIVAGLGGFFIGMGLKK